MESEDDAGCRKLLTKNRPEQAKTTAAQSRASTPADGADHVQVNCSYKSLSVFCDSRWSLSSHLLLRRDRHARPHARQAIHHNLFARFQARTHHAFASN